MPNLFSDVPEIDPSKNYFEELVGEGKKFSTPEELARGKAESDAYIARIEDEQRRLREELATRISLQDFQDKLEKRLNESRPEPQIQGEPNEDMSALKPEDVERLVQQKIAETKQRDAAEQNLSVVEAKLLEAYGPNYSQHLKRQVKELNMTENGFLNMAAANPKASLRLLGLDGERKQTNMFETPPRSQSTFAPSSGEKRGDSYYEKIRKEDPLKYWTPEIQNEIFNRISEIGQEEFDRT
jgi:hypothetical protein